MADAPALLAQLPPPPAIERFLFEQPAALVIVLAALGAATAYALISRGKTRWGVAALIAGLLLAGGAFLTSRLVTTPREQATAAVERFLESVRTADGPAADALLEHDVEFATGDSVADALARDTLVSTIDRFDEFEIKEWASQILGAVQDGPRLVRVHASVRVASKRDLGYPWPTTWMFTLRHQPADTGPGTWRIARMNCLTIFGKPADDSWIRYAQSPNW